MTRDTLTKKIEKHQSAIKDDVRDYIGASSIGSDCYRQIWYAYKGAPSEGVPAKTRRTWDIGKKLELTVNNWLIDAGVMVLRDHPELIHPEMPFFKGNVDGVLVKKGAESPYAIIEIKTAKNASYTVFVNKGVKVWNPQYYAQVQAYMGLSGIFSTYILALNKDNSDISDELVAFDEGFYKTLETKARMIALANSPPPRINGSPLFFKCKMCKYNRECHK
jgi:hypothetical protein